MGGILLDITYVCYTLGAKSLVHEKVAKLIAHHHVDIVLCGDEANNKSATLDNNTSYFAGPCTRGYVVST